MARTATSAQPADPVAWTLRDEIAMRLCAALVMKGTWGTTQPDGTFRRDSTMADHSHTAYLFADEMLKARERR